MMRNLKTQSPDWVVNRLTVDADIYRNQPELLRYSRDLWQTNPYFIAYGDEMAVNVHGPFGIRLRMRIMETEDRVVNSPEEKAHLAAHWRRRDNANLFLKRKGRPALFDRTYNERKAIVQAGTPDVFANTYIERKWTEWQRKENCTVTGRLSYNESRQLRLRSCARDGDHFIRLVRNAKYAFGFKIQHINSEWCDWKLNMVVPEKDENGGNIIRAGIEYTPDGLEIVAYHFIKASPTQWQVAPSSMPVGKGSHERIVANDIIHYARFAHNCDATRPAPWACAVMSNARQLAKYTEAAVVAARVGACSATYFTADVDGPDGMGTASADPRDLNQQMMQMTPGGMIGLPPGVKPIINNPNNPNQEFGAFRNENLREFCAGLPGASFPVIGQNYAEINFSAGRLDRLSTTGAWQMLQEFDIDAAERRIFEEWLKMALTVQAIKLPLAKFEKFNKPHFQGRRWPGVDPEKEIRAAASAVANKFTSRTDVIESGVCGESGDFEDTILKLAEEEMMLESLGMSCATTADTAQMDDEKTADELDNEDAKATAKEEA